MKPLDPGDLRTLIRVTLGPLVLYSADAEELLMATCAQESHLGEYRHQIHGPAIGIFQIEPADFNDIWMNFLAHKPALRDEVSALATTQPPRPIEMQDNDAFSVAMCRVHYLRSPRPLPAATDLNGIWLTYKVLFNSVNGAATQEQFVANYAKYVHGAAV